MAVDAAVAASSAAPDAAPAIPDLGSLTSEQRQSWRETGAFPTSDVSADSSTAPAETQPASTDATDAASETADPKDKPKGRGLQTRHQQLDAEISSLQEKLAARARLKQELESAPARTESDDRSGSSPVVRPLTDLLKSPDVTNDPLSETQFFEQYPDAPYGQYQRYLAKYEVAAMRAENEQQARQSEVEQSRQGRAGAFGQRIAEAVKADTAILKKLQASPVSQFLPADQLPAGTRPAPENILAQEVMMSEYAPQLLAHFADHPESLEDFLDKAPAQIIRGIGRLEARLAGSDGPQLPLPKTTSSAPPPPPQIHARATVPADDLDGALAAGDFRRYKELANAREVAARR